MKHGTPDERRVDCRDREIWLLLLKEVPGCLLGEGLGGTVGSSRRSRDGFIPSDL